MLESERYKDVDKRRELITKHRPDLAAQIQSYSKVRIEAAQEESSKAFENTVPIIQIGNSNDASPVAGAA